MIIDKFINLLQNTRIKKFIIYGFGQAINLISPLLVTPFIVYKCGEAGLGRIGVSLSLMFILIVIVDYGSYILGVKEVAINRDDKPKLQAILTKIYVLKFFLLLFICLFMATLIETIPYFEKEKALYFFSLFVLVGQFVNPGWFFQGIENFKWISITNITSKLIYIALVLLFVVGNADYVYVNFFLGIGAIIGNGIGILWIIKNYGVSKIHIDRQVVINTFKGDFRFCVSQLFLSSRQYLPILVVGYFCGNFIAGQYKIIEQIIMLFRTYLQMFFRFVYSSICFEIDKNVAKGLQVWAKYNILNFGIILSMVVMLFIFSESVLKFFKIDSLYVVSLGCLLRFSLIIPFLFSISNPLEQLLFAFEKNNKYITITIFSTFLNMFLLLLLVKKHVLYGAIISISVTEFILILAYYNVIKNNLKTKEI